MKIIYILVILFLVSCGADTTKTITTQTSNNSSQASLQTSSCGCTSEFSPVCGADGKDYDNVCIAKCFNVSNTKPGHCECSSNENTVCGSDGKDHTECEAKQSTTYTITKYIPCAAKGI